MMRRFWVWLGSNHQQVNAIGVVLVIPVTIFMGALAMFETWSSTRINYTVEMLKEFDQLNEKYIDNLIVKWPALSKNSGMDKMLSNEAEKMIDPDKPKAERDEETDKYNKLIRELMNFYEIRLYIYRKNFIDRELFDDEECKKLENYLQFFDNWRKVTKEKVNAKYPNIDWWLINHDCS